MGVCGVVYPMCMHGQMADFQNLGGLPPYLILRLSPNIWKFIISADTNDKPSCTGIEILSNLQDIRWEGRRP